MLVPPIKALRISDLTNVPQGDQPVHLYGYHVFNQNTDTVFIQFYNASDADVTPGVTPNTFVIPIPGTTSVSSPGIAQIQWVRPVLFNLSIALAATTGANNGAAMPSSVDVILFVDEA